MEGQYINTEVPSISNDLKLKHHETWTQRFEEIELKFRITTRQSTKLNAATGRKRRIGSQMSLWVFPKFSVCFKSTVFLLSFLWIFSCYLWNYSENGAKENDGCWKAWDTQWPWLNLKRKISLNVKVILTDFFLQTSRQSINDTINILPLLFDDISWYPFHSGLALVSFKCKFDKSPPESELETHDHWVGRTEH